jgi:corrinoid protein of di/trimethylamine methyltransferase
MNEILQSISAYLQKGRLPKVKELVQKALDEGVPAQEILNDGLLAGMAVIGEQFKSGEAFVPEVLAAARCMKQGSEMLKDALSQGESQSVGKAVIGTIKGDMHDIGKNLVKLMLESKGIEVVDLTVDVSPERFVAAITEHRPNLVCISALLTTTMGGMRDVVQAIDDAGLRSKVKVLVGGAPVTREFCDAIGADGYAVDAASAADMAVGFIKNK